MVPPPLRFRRKSRQDHVGDPALALWRQWRHWTVRVERLAGCSKACQRDLDAAVKQAFAVEDRLIGMPAGSLAGIRGKLEVYAYYARDAQAEGSIADRLVGSTIADLERLAGTAEKPLSGPSGADR